jgi:hypothetical protein
LEGIAYIKILAKAFVIAEKEAVVADNRAAHLCAKLIALKLGNCSLIKIIAGVHGAIAQIFVDGAVKYVTTGVVHQQHLCARALAVSRAVRVRQHVELT